MDDTVKKDQFLLLNLWIFMLMFLSACSDKSGNGINQPGGGSAERIPSGAIYPLSGDDDLDVLMEEIGDAELVLLGEASHGTSEFYTWRARLSRRLIEEKGFTVIAVEGDWTDALPLNNYIRGNSKYTSAEAALENFDRWPQWMWANEEIEDFAEYLKDFNEDKTREEQVGFYGLDVYGIWESLQDVHLYLQKTEEAATGTSQAVIDCFEPYNGDEGAYARATVNAGANCEDVISEMLEVLENSIGDPDALTEAEFVALQNAYVVANAETYYRTAARSNASSWNVRDYHMAGTMDRLLKQHGDGTKMIIWEHNTHVGDARATDMADAGMINIGQLARETYGDENVYIIGFSTYSGKVIAAQSWGSAARVMDVPPAQLNSWEWLLHNEEHSDKIVLMEPLQALPQFSRRIGHRAIGVVYDPKRESGNYVPSILPQRYDAFIFIDKTTALKPLSFNE